VRRALAEVCIVPVLLSSYKCTDYRDAVVKTLQGLHCT